jgi:hypothetical protein
MKEETLVKKSFQRIQRNTNNRVCREVPILGRSADLVYIKDDSLFSVEFKLHNWRRAIKQARDHQLATDYSYICMPNRNVSKILSEELRIYGIGLFFYKEKGEWPFEEVIKASRSFEVSEVARNWTLDFINEKKGAKNEKSGRKTHNKIWNSR